MAEITKTCATCKYWQGGEYSDTGACDWADVTVNCSGVPTADRPMVRVNLIDDTDLQVQVRTHRSFGCAGWK